MEKVEVELKGRKAGGANQHNRTRDQSKMERTGNACQRDAAVIRPECTVKSLLCAGTSLSWFWFMLTTYDTINIYFLLYRYDDATGTFEILRYWRSWVVWPQMWNPLNRRRHRGNPSSCFTRTQPYWTTHCSVAGRWRHRLSNHSTKSLVTSGIHLC